MLENLINSLLPEGFDLGATMMQFQNAMQAFGEMATAIARIEQKFDSEIVTARTTVADLTNQVETLRAQMGERNEHSNGGVGSADAEHA